MKATHQGIGISKLELVALLAHAAKGDDQSMHLATVNFVLAGDRCFAYATNGHRALEGAGVGDASLDEGEWQISRDFLDEAQRLLEPDQVLRLPFSGASLTEAHVEDKEGLQKSTLQWPQDAACAQRTFPELREMVQIPQHRTRGRCLTLNTEYMADLKKVSKAAGVPGVDLYPPPTPDKPIHFRCEAEDGTQWTGVIMPMRSDAAEAEAKRDEDPLFAGKGET